MLNRIASFPPSKPAFNKEHFALSFANEYYTSYIRGAKFGANPLQETDVRIAAISGRLQQT
jgi:hypothetical protein